MFFWLFSPAWPWRFSCHGKQRASLPVCVVIHSFQKGLHNYASVPEVNFKCRSITERKTFLRDFTLSHPDLSSSSSHTAYNNTGLQFVFIHEKYLRRAHINVLSGKIEKLHDNTLMHAGLKNRQFLCWEYHMTGKTTVPQEVRWKIPSLWYQLLGGQKLPVSSWEITMQLGITLPDWHSKGITELWCQYRGKVYWTLEMNMHFLACLEETYEVLFNAQSHHHNSLNNKCL